MDKASLLKEYASVFTQGRCELTNKDYQAFEAKKRLLIQLSQVENSSMTVFDMDKGSYALLQSKFDTQLCYPLNESFKKEPGYFFQLMPLPDLKFTVDTVKRTFTYLEDLEKSSLKEYKLIFEYRLSDPAGNLFRFLQQCMVLEQDKNGEIWMVLILNDLIPNRPNQDQLLRRLLHMPSGRICLFEEDNSGTSNGFLSRRESEILGLLSQGLQSKEISDKLFISVNTVNNHRQKIIEKLNAENTYEALRFARLIGIV